MQVNNADRRNMGRNPLEQIVNRNLKRVGLIRPFYGVIHHRGTRTGAGKSKSSLIISSVSLCVLCGLLRPFRDARCLHYARNLPQFSNLTYFWLFRSWADAHSYGFGSLYKFNSLIRMEQMRTKFFLLVLVVSF